MYVSKYFRNGLAGGAVAASMLLFAPLASAATADGSVGATSTGTVDVVITVPNLVLVENLDQIDLAYVAGGGDVTAAEPFCVWATAGTLYDITISSANGTGTFQANSGSDSVSYEVAFDDSALGDALESVVEGVTLTNGGTGYTASSQISPGCAADNAVLQVTAAEAGNLGLAVAGIYTDEMTLLVAPH
jgi:hypothetical protein